MTGVLTGFAVLTIVVAVGYVASRSGVLPAQGQDVLARVVFSLASPALLFITLLDAPLARVFSPLMLGIALSSLLAAGLFALLARLLWHRSVGEITIGALSSSYVNAANLGIPISAYVLGDASYVAPALLVQLLVMAPVALFILDVTSGGGAAPGRAWLRPMRNPIIIGSGLGLLAGALQVDLPVWVLEPVTLLAGAAVPLALLVFGMSLHGGFSRGGGSFTPDVLVAATVKVAVHPLIAYAVGRWLLGLSATDLYALTVIAALPTAQNIYVYAVRYGQSLGVARTAVLLSTVLALPGLLVVSAVLG